MSEGAAESAVQPGTLKKDNRSETTLAGLKAGAEASGELVSISSASACSCGRQDGRTRFLYA